ncbi:MAG TPA: flagellar filament capping protein FliD, partial [Clostridia bacterium]|nr:flagellar filament capping protein FliD [Clostridia bacterium]
QILTWKRDSYREVTSKLYDLKSKYYGTSNNVLANGSFNQLKVTNSAPTYVSVTPGPNANKTNIIISDIISLASSTKIESSTPVSLASTIAVDLLKTVDLSGKTIKVTLDGVSKVLTFSAQNYSTVDAVKNELSSMLDNAFGLNTVGISTDGNNLILDSGSNTMILSKSGILGQEAADILGFIDGKSNKISLNDKLSSVSFAKPTTTPIEFKINGVSFSFTGDNTISDVMNSVNTSSVGVKMAYSNVTDTFTFTSVQTGAGTNISLADVTGTFFDSIIGNRNPINLEFTGKLTDGKNAEIRINTNVSSPDPAENTYQTIIKNSNTFELDGVTYNLLGKATGLAQENIAINLDTDIDATISKIKDFISSYNDVLSTITGKLSEKLVRGYLPLTDDQKKAMSQTEIDLWTKQAKTGLLTNDTTLNSIATSLRSSFYSDVKSLSDNNLSIGLIPTDIGISTGLYSEKGKLNIDEAKLRKALTDRPEEVIRLLTQKSSANYSAYLSTDQKTTRYNESGLFSRISDIIENNTRQGGFKGNLIQLAGSATDVFETQNVYNDRITDMDKTISKLTDQLSKNQDHYWAKFTAMETALSTLNKQSSWITQQLGSLQNGG